MKKLTPRQIKWFRLRARNELRRHSRGRQRSATATPTAPPPDEGKIPLPEHVGPRPPTFVDRGSRRKLALYLRPPAVFSLRENYAHVASFLAHLRAEIYRPRQRGELFNGIDFRALDTVSPAAALILAAELFRWQAYIHRRLHAVKQREWNPDVASVLTNMGLFDFLQTPNVGGNARETASIGDISVLKYRRGTDVVGESCDDLLLHLTQISGPVVAENFIYDGLIEALKNSRQHAYTDIDRWFGVDPGTWFMSGSYSRSTNTLTAAVFDLGVGIPKTLPRATI